jgi:hypothetical protein
MVTFSPRFLSSRPNADAVIPFPREETTPPVTKMYLVISMIPPVFGRVPDFLEK